MLDIELLRDKHLIKERESYENEYFKIFENRLFEKDSLDILIESFNEDYYYSEDTIEEDYCSDIDDYYDDNDSFDFYNYQEELHIEGAYCGHNLLGYIITDELFNNLEGTDYP